MTTNQPGLFRTDARPTSKAAAFSVAGITGASRRTVYEFIRDQGDAGATDEQVINGTGLPASNARPRRVELVRDRVVIDSGRTRVTASGRAATVWIVDPSQTRSAAGRVDRGCPGTAPARVHESPAAGSPSTSGDRV